MTLGRIIADARATQNPQLLIDTIPYARLIGIRCDLAGEGPVFHLPRNDDNLGNPTRPALHGGVIGGFMEMAALLHLALAADSRGHLPKVIDLSIDYLRPGRLQDTWARCEVVRSGRSIVNVAVRAWQTHDQEPIATARAHFLLPKDAPPAKDHSR